MMMQTSLTLDIRAITIHSALVEIRICALGKQLVTAVAGRKNNDGAKLTADFTETEKEQEGRSLSVDCARSALEHPQMH